MIQKFRLCHGNNTKNKYKTFFFLIFYIFKPLNTTCYNCLTVSEYFQIESI